MVVHRGGCHCGDIRFEVDAPADLEISECNCSICNMAGYLHLIVSRSSFRLLQGEDRLSDYRFNTGVARHYFCSRCGVKSFYVPRSHPEGISVNANCVDPDTISSLDSVPFDGANWEENIHTLSPLRD